MKILKKMNKEIKMKTKIFNLMDIDNDIQCIFFLSSELSHQNLTTSDCIILQRLTKSSKQDMEYAAITVRITFSISHVLFVNATASGCGWKFNVSPQQNTANHINHETKPACFLWCCGWLRGVKGQLLLRFCTYGSSLKTILIFHGV